MTLIIGHIHDAMHLALDLLPTRDHFLKVLVRLASPGRHLRRVDRREEVDFRLRTLEAALAELRHAVRYLRIAGGILGLESLHLGARIKPRPLAPFGLLLLHLLNFDALLRKHVLELLDAGSQSAVRRTIAAISPIRLLGLFWLRILLGLRSRGRSGQRAEAKAKSRTYEKRYYDWREVSQFHFILLRIVQRRICVRAFP